MVQWIGSPEFKPSLTYLGLLEYKMAVVVERKPRRQCAHEEHLEKNKTLNGLLKYRSAIKVQERAQDWNYERLYGSL